MPENMTKNKRAVINFQLIDNDSVCAEHIGDTATACTLTRYLTATFGASKNCSNHFLFCTSKKGGTMPANLQGRNTRVVSP